MIWFWRINKFNEMNQTAQTKLLSHGLNVLTTALAVKATIVYFRVQFREITLKKWIFISLSTQPTSKTC